MKHKNIVKLTVIFFFLNYGVKCQTAIETSTDYYETSTDYYDSEKHAHEFSDSVDSSYNFQCNYEMTAQWAYITDVENQDAEAAANDADVHYYQFQKSEAESIREYTYEEFDDVELYRKFRFQKDFGPGGLDDDDLLKYNSLQSSMMSLYSTATICDYYDRSNCDLLLDPDLEEIMATSTDFEELQYVWEQWRYVSGVPMRQNYLEFVEYSNMAAVIDEYNNTGEYWLNPYTVTEKEVDGFSTGDVQLETINQDDFQQIAADIFQQVLEELYKPLHAYVRMKLNQTDFYKDYIDLEGTLPANILGNMWAQDWTNIGSYVMPFPDQPDFDVTQSMIDQNWDIDQMFDSAEDFFTSIGLYRMTDKFRELSVTNQTEWGQAMICHASAEDFCLGPGNTDFRIKMCTDVNMQDLVTVHHEMGHIEYFMAYTNLSHVFRTSANPGFHEAIGDVIALSVSTPLHMQNILNLTSSFDTKRDIFKNKATNYTEKDEQDINFLMRMALEKIAFLPFGYLIDKYRWGIFDGSITEDNLNAAWWQLREDYQGLSSPSGVDRGEAYFDAGSKYHISANVPYIRYFVSFIVQFQFQQKLCDEAGFTGNFYECDIYGNKTAGNLLLSSLKEGFSKPWPVILKQLGNSTEISADAIISYFSKLTTFINQELQDNNQMVGWKSTNETVNVEAADLLNRMDTNLTNYLQTSVEKSWDYNTDKTDDNLQAMNAASAEFSMMYNMWWTEELHPFDYSEVTDPSLRRQFELQQSIGTAILNSTDLDSYNTIVSSMGATQQNTVCPFENQNCDLDAGDGYGVDTLEFIMGNTTDYDELLYYWVGWRNVSGNMIVDDYPDYVNLTNKAATLNNFTDGSEMWLNPYVEAFYSSVNFQDDIENIWQEVKPFYEKLHAYVRRKLMDDPEYYQYFAEDGLIPANILGNMYALSWANIYDLVAPYPDIDLIDLSDSLEENIGNVTEMFEYSEDFFSSIGLFNMTDDFRDHSMYEQPPNRIVECHASAWDFYDVLKTPENGRFRIKMCTDKNQEDFITIHHEMGHIEYFMSYIDNPLIFRDGANPGFHEAIGDTIALSVSTPSHLQMIEDDLTDSDTTQIPGSDEQDLNFLMKQALDKVAFLPYAYIIDLWRWDAFQGKTLPRNYNRHWWQERLSYQGVKPPVTRTRDTDFDIGCKFHVPASVPYIRYFVATILQFQFHERLCNVSGNEGPIYNCDIYGSLTAGTALKDMLTKGRSQNWQATLAEFLDDPSGKMSASSLLSYFKPLIDYLDQQIADNDLTVGWDDTVIENYVPSSPAVRKLDDLEAAHVLYEMDANLTSYAQDLVAKTWNYYTDVNDETEAAMNVASAEWSKRYNYEWSKSIQPYDYNDLTIPYYKRQFELQQSIGTSILNDTDLQQFNDDVNSMTEKLNNKVCPFEKIFCNLETEGYDIDMLENLMATEKNYTKLNYYWSEWREVSGRQVLSDYPDYVALTNKAAVANKFDDGSDMWLDKYTDRYYTSDDFKQDIDDIWEQLRDDYELLHAYVRKRLKENEDYLPHFNEDRLIPASILGDMYSQSWVGIYEEVKPYKNAELIDLTPDLVEYIDDVKEMFDIAEEFFISIGLYPMNEDFKTNTLYEQPDDGRTVICHASAWDFYSTEETNSVDGLFRIKMCTNKTQDDFITIHHEMGHIQYYMSYGDQRYPQYVRDGQNISMSNETQPLVYRDGANPGFHEAIGDTIALSVSTPGHLQMISDYLKTKNSSTSLAISKDALRKFKQNRQQVDPTEEQTINFLFKQALDKFAFLPFAYIIDQWRWEVFEGTITPDSYNLEWWRKRLSYQGIRPPGSRSDNNDFDIGCKYHVPTNTPYIRYFVADILQFQFHEKLCDVAKYEGEVYYCDIFNNTDAGAHLKSMLVQGSSVPWLDQLQSFLEDENAILDATAMVTYFEKLFDFLGGEVDMDEIGWDASDSTLEKYVYPGGGGDLVDDQIVAHLSTMDGNLTVYGQLAIQATWDFYTDETPDTEEAMTNATSEFSSMYKFWWEMLIRPLLPDVESIRDPDAKRKILMQQSIGVAILNDTDFKSLNDIIGEMSATQNEKVCRVNTKCDDGEGIDIDDLEIEMGVNRDYSELMYYWEEWRQATGEQYMDIYPDYVDLMNMAAMENGFSNASEMWINKYTWDDYMTQDFMDDIDEIWGNLEEFYVYLHGYVRQHLEDYYEDNSYGFEDDHLIPAHLLGDMYGASWGNLYDLMIPFDDAPLVNITSVLVNQSNPDQMFKLAEDFFVSIGLYPMNDDFNENSMKIKPNDTVVVCHASAMDFRSNETDNIIDGKFRIKMCTNLNQDDFITIHHEMGHIEYFMAYSNESYELIYRNGANPGFHEAIGDTIALSVSTDSHLQSISDYLDGTTKIIKIVKKEAPKVAELSVSERATNYTLAQKKNINFLFKQALDKLAFLPYAYILDNWRWEVFQGKIESDVYNQEWWRKRIDFQGLRPPVTRGADSDFDIGCKYHVAANVPYIRYFVAGILQFQFHHKLCIEAKHNDLSKCDIYDSTAAGDLLKTLLVKGASAPWQDQLSDFLGSVDGGKMSANSMLKYFEPLMSYLKEYQNETGYPLGWKNSTEVLDDYITTVGDIGPVVPIVVGAVLAVLVCIVVVAFFFGQRKRKREEKNKKLSAAEGKANEAMELKDI